MQSIWSLFGKPNFSNGSISTAFLKSIRRFSDVRKIDGLLPASQHGMEEIVRPDGELATEDFSIGKTEMLFDDEFSLFGINPRKIQKVKKVMLEKPPQVFKPPKIDKLGRAYGTGKRKTAIAQVWIKEGNGVFIINGKPMVDYFLRQSLQSQIVLPFAVTQTASQFNVSCHVKGGGLSGQAGAVSLGLSRALENFIPSNRPSLKKEGLLTRDSRIVERKKPGQKKARKKFQWVKR